LMAISVANTGSAASSAYAAQDGILYTNDLSSLIAAPAGIGASVALAPECTAISQGAFWGNASLKTIIAKSNIASIDMGKIYSEASAGALNEATTEEKLQFESSLYTYNGIKYVSIPAFMPETVQDATVVINAPAEGEEAATAESDTAKAAWQAAGFTHFDNSAKPGDTIVPENGFGYTFKLTDAYTLEVSWTDTSTIPSNLSIPDFGIIKGVPYKVASIKSAGFANAKNLVTVSIPASVKTIGASAFANCENLKTVNLTNNVEVIEDSAFANTSLLSFVCPKNLKTMGKEALCGIDGAIIVIPKDARAKIDPEVIASSTNTDIYIPYSEKDLYTINTGLLANGNHIYPYGIKFADGIEELEVGQSVNLFENGGIFEVPGDIKVTYTYKAKSISIDTKTNTLTAKQSGAWSVDVDMVLGIPEAVEDNNISYKEIELAPASFNAKENDETAKENTSTAQAASTVQRNLRTLSARIEGYSYANDEQINVTVPANVSFGGQDGIDITDTTRPIQAETYFSNNGCAVVLESIECQECAENSISSVFETANGTSVEDEKLFSLIKDGASVDFGYNKYESTTGNGSVNAATANLDAFSLGIDESINCLYRLNLTDFSGSLEGVDARVKLAPDITDGSNKNLVRVVYTFKKATP
ncbi:leucine-rich repeat domain-containing protein, partial [Adlercreutzia sp. ZJ304]|uniref:leucine-rich repeat domain-containing protein n=1 Tax=Adlercreutzia sp. ZJ304 TaxID=2709791 RepID=UPI0013E9F0B5